MSDFVPKVVGGELPPRKSVTAGRTASPRVLFALQLLKSAPGQWVQVDSLSKEEAKKGTAGRWGFLIKHGAKVAQRTVGDTVNVYAMLPAEEPPAQG
jgi:hypothetical protein